VGTTAKHGDRSTAEPAQQKLASVTRHAYRGETGDLFIRSLGLLIEMSNGLLKTAAQYDGKRGWTSRELPQFGKSSFCFWLILHLLRCDSCFMLAVTDDGPDRRTTAPLFAACNVA
jgi:hypothetical protein